MLDGAAGAGAHRVGREERKGVLLVATILCEMQTHLADDVPGRMARAQPISDRSPLLADLVRERAPDLGPACGDPVGVDVFRTWHGWDSSREVRALVRRAIDLEVCALLFEIRRRTQTGGERAADLTQERDWRRQRRVELDGAEVEESVSCAAGKRGEHSSAGRRGKPVARFGVVDARRFDEQRAGREDGDPNVGRALRTGQRHATKCILPGTSK
jgi:hypothetical protein